MAAADPPWMRERRVLGNQKGIFMFYRKNLPGWERAMRVVAGVAVRELLAARTAIG